MRKLLIILLCVAVYWPMHAQRTLQEGMEMLRQKHGISYIYDASLPIQKAYRGEKPDSHRLEDNLDRLFAGSGIQYAIKGRQVILKRQRAVIPEDATLSTPELLDSAIVVDWRMPILTHPASGALGITRLTVEQAPVLLGEKDVLKTLQMLPGVQAAAEGFSGVSVRGGYSDETLILLDGIPILQAEHLLGLFSIFPAESIEGATLWKGNFPAKFGGRASGIIDLQSAQGNRQGMRGGFTVGLLSDRFHLDGPLGKKVALSANGRILHTFLAQPVVSLLDKGANYFFYDVNLRLDWFVTDKDRITITGYNGDDLLNLHNNSYKYEHRYDENYAAYNIYTNQYDKSRYGWGSSVAALSWRHGDIGRTTLAFTNARMRTDASVKADYDTDGVHSGKEKSYGAATSLSDIVFKTDWTLGRFSFGGEYTRHYLHSDGLSSLYTETTPDKTVTRIPHTVSKKETVPAHEAALYVDASIPLAAGFSIHPGLRLSCFHAMGKTRLSPEPRLSVRWSNDQGWHADAGYARMVQYFHRIPSGYTSFPTDFWHTASASIPPLTSDQFSICGRYKGLPGWEFSAELYYKIQQGVVEYKNSYTQLGTSQEDWTRSVASGNGRGMGMELMVRKTAGRLTGWLGYTLSRNTRVFPDGSVNNGQAFPASTDRRHRINFCASWAVSETVDITLAWTFASGCPLTIINRAADIYDESEMFARPIRNVDYAPSRNNYSLPPVHRADISVNLRKPCQRGERIWTFGLYNLYGAQNPDFIVTARTNKTMVGSEGYNPDMQEGTPLLKTTSFLMFVPTVSFTRNF